MRENYGSSKRTIDYLELELVDEEVRNDTCSEVKETNDI